MLSTSVLTILSYNVSKFARFFETQCSDSEQVSELLNVNLVVDVD